MKNVKFLNYVNNVLLVVRLVLVVLFLVIAVGKGIAPYVVTSTHFIVVAGLNAVVTVVRLFVQATLSKYKKVCYSNN